MKYWFDTEFLERGRQYPLELLTLGMVNEQDEKLYLIRDDPGLWNTLKAMDDQWLQQNVVPALHMTSVQGKQRHIDTFSYEIKMFIGTDPKPRFYGYFADYDWVLFAQLFGTMITLPKGWPQYCRDIKQTADENNIARFPAQTSVKHNALNDAIWTKDSYDWMMRALNGGQQIGRSISIGGSVIGSRITTGHGNVVL